MKPRISTMWSPKILDRFKMEGYDMIIVASDRDTSRADPSFIGEIIALDDGLWEITGHHPYAMAQPISTGEHLGLRIVSVPE